MAINIDSSSARVNLNKEVIISILKRHMDYLLPIFVIAACFVILVFIVVPEFKNYLSSRELLEAETQKLNTLKNNYNFLTNLDDKKNDQDFKTLSYALPPNKDFTGIISAISIASAKTGVGVGDFSFSLGNLSKVEEQIATPSSSIRIEINLIGNAKSITEFVKELYKTVPISEVNGIKTIANAANLVILFYYKPFPPQNISDEAPVIPISTKGKTLITDVYKWNNALGENIFTFAPGGSLSASLSSSQSASTNPSPF